MNKHQLTSLLIQPSTPAYLILNAMLSERYTELEPTTSIQLA